MTDTAQVDTRTSCADPALPVVAPANEIPFVHTWRRDKPAVQRWVNRHRNAAFRALIEAALDQPNPSPALVTALARLAKL